MENKPSFFSRVTSPSGKLSLVIITITIISIIWSRTSQNLSEKKDTIVVLQGETMGTYYDVRYEGEERVSGNELDKLLRDFENELSSWKRESTLSRFNRENILTNPSIHFKRLIEASFKVNDETNGAFDPTVGSLVTRWGFNGDELERIPTQQEIDSLMQYVGMDKITYNSEKNITKEIGVNLNFSAIAKGYGCDVVADFLSEKAIKDFKVEIGGEIVVKGSKQDGPWKIGIETPSEKQRSIHTILTLTDCAMATSGNYRNYILKGEDKYPHTIDPTSGMPIQREVLSASVISNNCMEADAYATAFMVMGLEKIKKTVKTRNDLEVFIIYEDSTGQHVWLNESMRKRIVTP